MKHSKAILTGLLIIVIGVVLILCSKLITSSGIVTLGGVLFLATGIVEIIVTLTDKAAESADEPQDDKKPAAKRSTNSRTAVVLAWIVSVASIILGLCMLIFNDSFSVMIPFVFSLLVFVSALVLTFVFAYANRGLVSTPAYMWILPVGIVVLAAVIFIKRATIEDPLIMVLSGSAMITFGVGMATTGIIGAHASRLLRKASKVTKPAAQQKDVVDVEAKEIKPLDTK